MALLKWKTREEGRVRILKKILFVCSGNTCRSPLAEGIAKKVFSHSERQSYDVFSAGSSALDGLPASSLAIEVAKENSIDLSDHQASLLGRSLVRDADLIVAMAASHRETIAIIEPSALEYTYLLTDFCDVEDGDIPDPIGMGKDIYTKTFSVIDKCINEMKTKFKSFDGWKKVEGR